MREFTVPPYWAAYVTRSSELLAIFVAHNLTLAQAGELDAIKKGYKAWMSWQNRHARKDYLRAVK